MGGVRTMTHGSEAVFSLTSAPAAISICTICAFISQDDASSLLLHWRSKLNAETLNVACSATWLKNAVSSVALLALVAVVLLLLDEGIAFGQSKRTTVPARQIRPLPRWRRQSHLLFSWKLQQITF